PGPSGLACGYLLSSGAALAAQACKPWSLRRPRMAIVMGLDQHRAQITAEWIDTETGEVSRSRISPAHRAGVRRFAERFRGQELEVALEATTGCGSWPRSCSVWARWCIWRSRLKLPP